MIFAEDIENSIVALINQEYPTSDIFRRKATQTKPDTPTFVVNVSVNTSVYFKDYQEKDVEITVQYFINDKIEFNKNYNHVRDILLSKIFINSIPIIDTANNVVKYVIAKQTTATIIDDILAVRVVTDYVDDVIVTNHNYDLMGVLHLNKEC